MVHESEIYAQHNAAKISSVVSTDTEQLAQQAAGANTSHVPAWVKFEYFNLPVSKANDHHSQIAAHFEFLRDQYILANHISE